MFAAGRFPFRHFLVFPLTGAHSTVSCDDCHHGNYSNTPNTCNGCHAADFSAAANPNHVSLNLPTDCATCHSTADWQPASFAIHNQFYQLNGAHAAIANDCAACHNGNYNSTPMTCAGCHTSDFNQTTNPNHTAAQFPTTCADCHSETAWTPAIFDHDAQYFPIYSGKHKGEWDNCTDCHANPSNYSEITCTNCHTNPQTDNEHAGVGGYSYNSAACLACHPTGDGDNVFNHNSTNFPLTGAHQTADCLDCHAAGFAGTPTACAACHNADFSAAANPNHVSLNLPTDCATCHSTADWQPASFAIHNQFYQLNGAHAAIANDCAACHNGNYNSTPNTCAGCHTSDFNQTSNPNHAAQQFPTTCATCHTETAWVPSTFDHNSIWALTGAHAAATCNECHANGNFSNTPNTCNGCHAADFSAAANPNHVSLNLPTDCATCHSTADWQPASFAIHNQFYQLNGAHAAIANDCAACHNGNYNSTPNTCAGCHTDDYQQTTNPNHTAAQFPTTCADCHSETAWTPANFDHDGQYFPIYSGKHKGEWDQCMDCHANPSNYSEITCTNCHTNPQTDNEHAGVGGYSYNSVACLACHPTGDADIVFDHNSTGFPLTGAHQTVACLDCHANGFPGTPTDCAACHAADFSAAANPNHVSLNLPTDCASCHTTAPGWAPATFAIHNLYYALNGAHAAIANDCATCHNGNYNNTPNTCAGCHTDDYNQTTNPNHAAAQFPTTCATCHSEAAWTPATFDHNTVWALTGAHATTACAECHVNGNYNNTPTTCAGCHTPDYNSSTNPSHVALNLPNTCNDCHTTDGWEPATFAIHNQFYPLNGAHAAIANDCATCHNGNYNNTPNTCNGCHNDDYQQTTDPNHVANQFPTDCALCHSETAWVQSTFDHAAIWALTGAHATTACAECHVNGNYNNTPTTCAGCHTPDYNSSTNPSHVALNLPNTCNDCHSTDAWEPATFAIHNQFYPLNGAHAAIANDCATCHNGNYNNTPNTCNGCHNDDYQQATDPNHVANQFPTDCTLCHSENAWVPSSFDHAAIWPLTGAHATTACAECHINGNYNNTPTTCAGCHTPDYNASTNPSHVALNLPTTCNDCHTTDGWEPATFAIHNQFYPLNGAHAAIANDCATCHNGNYNNTPNTCNGCHNDDYQQATNPNHVAAGFPTNCTLCHDENAWVPSSFDHNAIWPLNGAHNSTSCAACHGNFSTPPPTTCVGCHLPDYNQTNNPPHAAAGFPTTCATCHDENAWQPANWDHNFWPLTGAHASTACAQCHPNGNYNPPTTCVGCHLSDYNQTNDPPHSSAGFPTTCQTCHNTAAWEPSTWNHDTQYFPIYSGEHEGEWDQCSDCHTTPGNYTQFNCLNCHNNPGDLADEHDDVPGYQYNNAACYACHPNGDDD